MEAKIKGQKYDGKQGTYIISRYPTHKTLITYKEKSNQFTDTQSTDKVQTHNLAKRSELPSPAVGQAS